MKDDKQNIPIEENKTLIPLLVEGLSCRKDTELAYLSFLDLHIISKYEPLKRKTLYDPNVWPRVCDRSISLLEELSDSLMYAAEVNISQQPLPSGVELRKNVMNQVQKGVFQLEQNLFKYSGKEYTKFIFRNLQIEIWAIESLSFLLHHSKEEDNNGSVLSSNSLRTVLVCFASLGQQLERYVKSVPMKRRSVILEQPSILSNVLSAAIYKITTNFYEDLQQIQFPSFVLQSLQSYVDFRK